MEASLPNFEVLTDLIALLSLVLVPFLFLLLFPLYSLFFASFLFLSTLSLRSAASISDGLLYVSKSPTLILISELIILDSFSITSISDSSIVWLILSNPLLSFLLKSCGPSLPLSFSVNAKLMFSISSVSYFLSALRSSMY